MYPYVEQGHHVFERDHLRRHAGTDFPMNRGARLLSTSLGIGLSVVLLGGCSNDEPSAAVTEAASTWRGSEIISTPPDVYAGVVSTTISLSSSTGYSAFEAGVAVVAKLNQGTDEIKVFADELTDTPEQIIKRTTTKHIVFLAEGGTPNRLKVHLPTRPNGSMGWIDRTEVDLRSNFLSVDISLSGFKLTVSEKGKQIYEAPIGIGKDDVPTPDGFYYTIFAAKPKTPGGVYGNFVLGLSGFSEVLETFGSGNGRLGIHGTNRPDLIGQQVSNGCIRLNNIDIDYLVKTLPLGTPVRISA
jgi:lipoprotein-anchoring transpeptidase ErfK/SrfK